ncbi:hypothetical protein L226DRAFT_536229 [Lentinus tigrinus ALCF2SS1-7]|uniref:uncharacterized protein n=1 Tax=Lentinus tigrinus ALCF2SS1-7 TaxID=1328758 RepID=UPI0011661177|nr:hypothetical protein L226DRAFT_536229 [Lentinus tigrinus ALCF2SS1-7]
MLDPIAFLRGILFRTRVRPARFADPGRFACRTASCFHPGSGVGAGPWIVYERNLRDEGDRTKSIQYAGCLHAFHYAFPDIPAAIKLDRDAREGIWSLLSPK